MLPNTDRRNFNRYWYANDNPYRYTDPDGRQEVPEDEIERDGRVEGPAQQIHDAANGLRGRALLSQIQKIDPKYRLVQSGPPGSPEYTDGTITALRGDLARLSPNGAINLTSEQAKNAGRFAKKVPANAKDSISMKQLPNNGVAAQARSPGRVSGSSAVYEKQIDSNGKTVQYTKTTYDPQGNIVHVKDKLSGGGQ